MEETPKHAGSGETNGTTLNDREPVPVPRSQVTVKTVATICAVVLGAAAAAWLIVHSAVAIVLVLVAAMLAMALNHAVEALRRRRVPRVLAIVLVMTAVLAVIAGIILLVAPPAVAQGKELAENGPELWQKLQQTNLYQSVDSRVHLGDKIEELRSQQSGLFQRGAAPLAHLVGVVFAGLGGIVTILFLVIFMLLFGGNLVKAALHETLPAHRERYRRVLGKIYTAVGGYLNGLGVIAVLNATLMSIFLAIVRVPFFLPLGLLSGLGSLIPLVGASASGLVIILVALATKGPVAAIAAIIYILVYQQFENHVVVPVVYKRTVQVNPLVTIVGLVFLAELAGPLGAFLAVPLIASAQIVLRELLVLRRERLGLPLEGDVARVEEGPRRFHWRKREA